MSPNDDLRELAINSLKIKELEIFDTLNLREREIIDRFNKKTLRWLSYAAAVISLFTFMGATAYFDAISQDASNQAVADVKADIVENTKLMEAELLNTIAKMNEKMEQIEGRAIDVESRLKESNAQVREMQILTEYIEKTLLSQVQMMSLEYDRTAAVNRNTTSKTGKPPPKQ